MLTRVSSSTGDQVEAMAFLGGLRHKMCFNGMRISGSLSSSTVYLLIWRPIFGFVEGSELKLACVHVQSFVGRMLKSLRVTVYAEPHCSERRSGFEGINPMK